MGTRTVKPRETFAQAINRLAIQAREREVKVFVHDLGTHVEYFATSVSRPGTLHRVTALSCDCPGFVGHQRCMHLAALLDAIGELPQSEPPDPAAMTEIRAARVQTWQGNVLEHAERWLTSLIERQERGETVPERDIWEATERVATYSAAAAMADLGAGQLQAVA